VGAYSLSAPISIPRTPKAAFTCSSRHWPRRLR
jgi:hypothetical protein